MNDTSGTEPPDPTKLAPNPDSERTRQVTAAGYTAGVSAVVALVTLLYEPSWPVAFGVAAVAAMVAVVCFCMLKH